MPVTVTRAGRARATRARRRGRLRIRPRASVAVALAAAIVLTGSPRSAPSPLARTIPGIDVSHWQQRIDWSSVAAAGYRFAFVKATEGRARVDPWFARNLRGAQAAGLMVGAYHFARPNASPGDAVAEANEFLRVARPRPGELVPMLDLETNGDLDPADLRAWALAWLTRVRAVAGVRPIIYASPRFWRTRMGNPTSFAGYPLMLADHSPPPAVPAHDWSALGWTIWQWSICGTVPGVRTCVDLDVLRVGRIPTVRVP